MTIQCRALAEWKKNHFAGAFFDYREVTVTDRQTAMRRRPMPFTEEQMKQVFDTNIIDFAVSHGFEVEKGDRNTVHVKHSGGLYLFRHGRGYYQFAGEKSGNIIQFAQEYLGAADFKSAVEMILGCRAYEQTEHYVTPVRRTPEVSWCCRRKIKILIEPSLI